MLVRKRKSALENYIDTLTEPPEKVKKMATFYNNLKNFYRRKWNAPLKLPNVQGVEVNLYRLYDTVMALGGWLKVSGQEKWPDVAEMMGVRDEVICGDHALKLIYMRYLSKFEQVETVGDIDEMMDEMRGRGRASFFATNENPISLSRTHEYVRRDERGNPSTEPDYSKIFRSLLSGLPNEVDFAINVCTLLSHPGPRLMRLSHSPHIPTLLVAHCGIFDDEGPADLSDLYRVWAFTTQRDYTKFWANSGVPKDILEIFAPHAVKEMENIDVDGEFLHGINPEYDVGDPMSWRVNQILTILRNFSFEPINRVTMSECWPLLKFLMLCSVTRWVPLYTAAMDTLSNIASDINLTWDKLEHEAHHALLRIVKEGITSNDKFKLIRSMETLTGLCMYEGNEAVLNEFLSNSIFDRIFDIICIKDIMMCVYALECLYQLSEMGDIACDLISQDPRRIKLLVSMSTLEAVSFGPAGLAGMKVVEFQPQPPMFAHGPPPGAHPHPGPSTQPGQHGHPMPQGHGQYPMPFHPMYYPAPQQQGHFPPGAQGTPHRPGVPPRPMPGGMHTPQHGAGLHPMQQQHTPATVAVQPPPRRDLIQTPARPATPGNATGFAEGSSKVDQLTDLWIKKNCVFDPTASTPRGELYAAYVDDLRNQYYSISGSLAMFSNVMKQIHPTVQFKMDNLMMVVVGIRLARPHKLAPLASQVAASPAPPATPPVATPVSQAQSVSHPLMKQILTKNLPPTTGPQSPATVNGSTPTESSRSASPADAEKTGSDIFVVVKSEKKAVRLNGQTNGNGVAASSSSSKSSTSNSPEQDAIAATELLAKVKEEKAQHEEAAKKLPTPAPVYDFMCEWDGCGRTFKTNQLLLLHSAKDHMTDQAQPCKWPGCDGTLRNRWSLVTHIQDHHAQEHILAAAAQKRKDGQAPAVPPPYRSEVHREVPQHPGYARHAAIDAIRRHAFNFLPRDITDEPEGPVTKSIRLTSCLIMRNLARYSAEGRRLLRAHEKNLCWLALSRLESSHALAQLLSELHPAAEEQEETGAVDSPALPQTPSQPDLLKA